MHNQSGRYGDKSPRSGYRLALRAGLHRSPFPVSQSALLCAQRGLCWWLDRQSVRRSRPIPPSGRVSPNNLPRHGKAHPP
ncbi:Uncharacterised protein [Vibrio cholerae]|nr:Uncharacterised protein [Vibrio cholerae]